MALVAPAIFVSFLCHWYVGVPPPFVGVAVKVTEVPALEQIDVEVLVILTEGTMAGLTVIVPVVVVCVQVPVVVTV